MGRNTRRSIWVYLLCYALLAVVLVLEFAIFFIWRVAILELLNAFNARSYANRALYMLGVIGIGMTLFAVIMIAEPYLRFGVERHQLMRRFGRVAVPLAVAAVVGLVIQFVLPG